MIRHVALIMDGNRRWAAARGLPSHAGHSEGAKTVATIAEFCIQKAIPHVSLYAFSLENLTKRSAIEREFLFDLVANQLIQQFEHFIHNNIRIRFIGDRSLFPQRLIESITHIEQQTVQNTALTVDILFCYGGQQEIVAAAQKFAQQVVQGRSVNDLTVNSFAELLWNAPAVPPDLVIRTGGRLRLSNFLLFQVAYAELYCTETFWPDFSVDELQKILNDFTQRTRNFGV